MHPYPSWVQLRRMWVNRFTEYDDLGREVATIDARGIRTEHEYNDRGEKTAIRYADGTSELFTYDRAGRQTSMADRAGRTTVYRYDKMDRRIEAIMPDLTPGDLSDNPRMLMEYNLRGEMTAEIDPNGNRTEYTYDPAGNRIAVNRITADGLIHETQFIYDAADRQVEVIDELGRSTVTTYDAAGRQQTTTFADSTQTETVYIQSEGARIVIDEKGNATRHEFDGEGRLIAVEDALSQRTEYTYDERGRMVAQTDAEDHITRYEYDGADRRTAVILPLLQRSESTYDEAGNLLVETNFNGDTIAYEYQQFNNWVDTKTITVDGAVEEVVTYQYTPVGLVSQIDDELGTTVYNYDAQDRMLSRIDPDSASISYTYDLAGNRTSVTSASGTTTYVFDDLNRLIEVSDPDVGATIYSYDLIGNLIQTELPNGVIETREYDDRYRLTLIDTENSSGTTLARYEYERDAVGNIVRTTEDGGDRVVEYDYDALYRLTRESIADVVEGDRDISYTYDAVGNRQVRNDTGEGITTYTYDDNDRLLTETLNGITTTYTYDDQGQIILKSSSNGNETIYTWNGEGQLVKAEVNTNDSTLLEEYRYNDQGIRVRKISSEGSISYLVEYIGSIRTQGIYVNEPLAKVREVGDLTTGASSKHISGLSLAPIMIFKNGKTIHYHGDQIGSVRVISENTGEISNRYTYDGFGRILRRFEATQNSYLYAGELFDESISLTYLRARYLDLQVGRFLSRDKYEGTLLSSISRHSYLYANANPIVRVDPSGYANFTLQGLKSFLVKLGILSKTTTTTAPAVLGASGKTVATYTLTPGGLALAGAAGGGVTVTFLTMISKSIRLGVNLLRAWTSPDFQALKVGVKVDTIRFDLETEPKDVYQIILDYQSEVKQALKFKLLGKTQREKLVLAQASLAAAGKAILPGKGQSLQKTLTELNDAVSHIQAIPLTEPK